MKKIILGLVLATGLFAGGIPTSAKLTCLAIKGMDYIDGKASNIKDFNEVEQADIGLKDVFIRDGGKELRLLEESVYMTGTNDEGYITYSGDTVRLTVGAKTESEGKTYYKVYMIVEKDKIAIEFGCVTKDQK